MGRAERLGEFEALVLAAVVWAGGDANGTAIYRELESRSGRSPAVAGVHVTLRRLEGKGLLRSEVGSSSSKGGRPRRYYAPTPDGIEALRAFHTVWTRVLTGLPLPDLETGG